MAGFSGLTFAVVPLVEAGVVNAGLVAGTTVIAGILDPISAERIFNPAAEGNPVASGDAYTKWLPVIKTISGTTVVDNYWASVPGSTVPGPTSTGQVKLVLSPAAANTVEASSVLEFWLSPQALILTCTAGTF
jgi:hypothetical protein